jgi:hypothetical protein
MDFIESGLSIQSQQQLAYDIKTTEAARWTHVYETGLFPNNLRLWDLQQQSLLKCQT